MKIAIASSGLGHVTRGIESWAKEIAGSLKGLGLEVGLYKGGGSRESNIEKVIPCIRRHSKLAKYLKKIMPSFAWRFGFGSQYQMEATTFTLNLIPHLIINQYDIIHTKEAASAIILQYFKNLNIIKSKIIVAHGTNESAEFLNNFEIIQYLTPYDFQRFEKKLGMKKNFIIPNFVDIKKFSPSGSSLREEFQIDNDSFVILSAGMITDGKYKNMKSLIKEVFNFKKKVDRDIYLIIAGSIAHNISEIIRFGKELLKEHMIFLVEYPHNLMPKLYASADLFILCSLFETFGTVLLEAMASGVACICHKHPVMEWVIGEGGESVDMTEEGTLAKALEKYINANYRATVGKKGRERVISNFSKEKIINQTIEMYEAVLNGK